MPVFGDRTLRLSVWGLFALETAAAAKHYNTRNVVLLGVSRWRSAPESRLVIRRPVETPNVYVANPVANLSFCAPPVLLLSLCISQSASSFPHTVSLAG